MSWIGMVVNTGTIFALIRVDEIEGLRLSFSSPGIEEVVMHPPSPLDPQSDSKDL